MRFEVNLIVSIKRHFLVGFEWLYFSEAYLEPKIWQNEKSMFKNAESIIKIAKKIADIGNKSANSRRNQCSKMQNR